MYQNKTLVYNDESRLASITYGGVTDTYTYSWQGLRTRAYLAGTYYRYLYNGDRVLQELTDAGAVNATYTTENDSYYGTLLHLQRATGESRFPLYDEIGSARGLVDASGTVTDTYSMDVFGLPLATTGATPNPYRYGAAWGYITDPSGLLQLGARYYWPEVGRFVSQDPEKEGINWYAYVENEPLLQSDPTGYGLIGFFRCLWCTRKFGQAIHRCKQKHPDWCAPNENDERLGCAMERIRRCAEGYTRSGYWSYCMKMCGKAAINSYTEGYGDL